MGYISYSEGFKGGGWNSHFNAPQTPEAQAQFQKFDQEEAGTFEVGFKLDLLDDTLRLNGSVFTTDYDGLQFTYRVGVAPYLANAGKASIDGAELEATWVPSSNWMIKAGLGTLSTSVDELREIAGTGIGVSVGNALPFSPELQANLGINYTTTLSNGATLTPRMDVFYQDKTFFDANNTVEIAQLDSVSGMNLAIAYALEERQW